jgi:hypothetical protein
MNLEFKIKENNMKCLRITMMLLMLFMGCMALTGCDNDGPAENAGEKVDEAVDDMKDTAEETANDIKDKVDDVSDKMD